MKFAVFSSAVLLSTIPAYATTPAYWLGGDGTYGDSTKWSTGVAPTTADYDAIVNTTGSILLNGSATVNSLTLNNAASTVMFNSSGTLQAGTLEVGAGSFNLAYGTLKNTVVTGGANGGKFVFYSTLPTLDNVTLATGAISFFDTNATVRNNLTINASVNIPSGNYFGFVNGGSLLGNGEVVVNGRPATSGYATNFYAADGTLTLGQNLTVRTGTYTTGSGEIVLGDAITGQNLNTFINLGTISCQTDPMAIDIRGHWTNSGKLRLSAGTLRLGGYFTPASLGDFVRTGGSVLLNGQIDASGGPLVLNATTGSWDINGSIYGSTAGRINNGTVQCLDGTQLTVTTGGNATFDNVTLAGKLNMSAYSTFRVLHDLTLSGGTIAMLGGNTDQPTNMDFTGASTVGGTGSILFGGNNYNQITAYNDTGTLTFGPGISLRADNGGFTARAVAGSPITFQGNVSIGPGGQGTLTGPVTIGGTTTVESGGTLSVVAGTGTISNLANLSNNTLTGGTFVIGASGFLRIPTTISTNAATIVLAQSSGGIYAPTTGATNALSTLTTNAATGAIELGNGVQLQTTGLVNNLGTITTGANAIFRATGGMTSPGTLAGLGQFIDDITDAGRISPGTVATPQGTLRVTGNLSLGSNSQLNIGLASNTAAQNDHLTVSGAMAAAGTLSVSLANGYVPTDGRSYDILDFASITGAFTTLDLPALASGLSWNTSRLYVDGTLSVTPEPGSLACILAVGALLRRGRRR